MTKQYCRLNDRVVLGFGASNGLFVPDYVEQEVDKLLKVLSNCPDCDGHRNEFEAFYSSNDSMGILCRPFIGNSYQKAFIAAYITGHSLSDVNHRGFKITQDERKDNLIKIIKGEESKYSDLIDRFCSREDSLKNLDYGIRIESPDSTASRIYVETPIRRNSPKKWIEDLSELKF